MVHRKQFMALAAAGLISVMSLGSAFTAYADGWTKSGDKWTYVENNATRKGWVHTSDGYYYMDLSTGYMSTGFVQIDGKWYFFKPNGLMATGWVNTDDKWYYMLDDGTMVTGWLKIDRGNNEVDYYDRRGDGSMGTGWREMDNAWYYFQSNGK